MNREKESGRASKLEPFKEDILTLKQNGFSQKQIQRFLAENNLSVGLTTINWFIRTRMNSPHLGVVHNESVNIENEMTSNPISQSTNDGGVTNLTIPKGKFNWQTEIPDSEMF